MVQIQLSNTERKARLITNLAKEHPDTLSKANIDKWNDHLKIINQAFDNELDAIIKKLMDENEQTEKENNQRYSTLRSRLIYIGKRSE